VECEDLSPTNTTNNDLPVEVENSENNDPNNSMFVSDDTHIELIDLSESDDESEIAEEEDEFFDCIDSGTSKEPLVLSLAEELLMFATMFNLSRSAVNYLLCILNRHNIIVPKSAYKLQKFDQSAVRSIKNIISGTFNYAYLSIKDNFQFLLDKSHIKPVSQTVSLKINIDGLPLFKSSKVCLWPITMHINESTYSKPLPIAVFCGVSKPPLEKFIQPLVDELSSVLTTPLKLNEVVSVSIKSIIFICDAPARSFLQCIKNHNGYFGCGYCTQKGERHEERIIFPSTSASLRTDASYSLMSENNQISLSPLATVVPLFSSFVPDYMHLVCLGIVPKLLRTFFFSTPNRRLQCRLSCTQREIVNERIRVFASAMPSEFVRKVRTVEHFEFFKASEFRTWILYAIPFIFKGILPQQYMDHLLMLHFSVYSMCSDKFHKTLYANYTECLKQFVNKTEVLYGRSFLIYNMHVLTHLPLFVKMYGPLDSQSAFIFESYLSLVKKRIKCSRNVFQQTVGKLHAIRDLYGSTSLGSFKVSNRCPDNAFEMEDGTIVLSNSENANIGTVLKFSSPLYTFPYDSKYLGIGFYSITDIQKPIVGELRKCIALEQETKYIIMPLANKCLYCL